VLGRVIVGNSLVTGSAFIGTWRYHETRITGRRRYLGCRLGPCAATLPSALAHKTGMILDEVYGCLHDHGQPNVA